MKANYVLRFILMVFLVVAVIGCGEQSNNPLVEITEEDTETIPLIFESPDLAELTQQGDRNDPYGNFRFRVEIDGIVQAGFSEAMLSDSTVTVIEYREGNEPNPVSTRKLPGLTKWGSLILKWGITENMELYNWFRSVSEGKIDRRNLSVILQDEEGNDGPRWNFTQAWPSRYDAPDFDALGDFIAIETLEIVFERMEREM